MKRTCILIVVISATMFAEESLTVSKLTVWFDGHSDRVDALAFSPSKKWLASGRGYNDSGFGNSEIKVWDAQTESVFKAAKLRASLRGKLNEEIKALRFLDEDTLLVISENRALRWSIKTDEKRWIYKDERFLMWGKNAASLITGKSAGDNKKVRIRRVHEGLVEAPEEFEFEKWSQESIEAMYRTIAGSNVYGVSNDWKVFFTIEDNSTRIFEMETGKEKKQFQSSGWFATISNDSRLIALETRTGVEIRKIEGDASAIVTKDEPAASTLSFSHNGELLAIGHENGKVRIYKVERK
jgi:WD40 repeat protein